jgi:hypothetical protein
MTQRNARHDEALRLRNEGMSYGAIARQLGYGNYPSAARYAVMSAIRNQVSTNTDNEIRQFGVEAEFFGITAEQAIEAVRAIGVEIDFDGYTHEVMPRWKIVTDSSVSSQGTGRGSGLELVSPIMRGEEGLREVEKVLNAIDGAGGKVNTTCGLHVHVDTAGMTPIQRKNFFFAYVRNQDMVDRLVSKSRRNNRHYTQRYETERAINHYAECVENGQGGNSRFYTVNTCSIPKYGTLEFRQHQGTLNGKKVVAWVQMLLAIAYTASKTTEEGYTTYNTVEEFLDGNGVDETTKAYIMRREAQLNRQATVAA